jgi:hypothetical protein
MPDPRDYKLDIASLNDADPTPTGAVKPGRPFLSVKFACCNVYCRIYRNNDGSRYEGRCPKCGRPVRFLVGHGGTESRFFVVE